LGRVHHTDPESDLFRDWARSQRLANRHGAKLIQLALLMIPGFLVTPVPGVWIQSVNRFSPKVRKFAA
jgi:hypothetical protein